jgi:hypothetical protein
MVYETCARIFVAQEHSIDRGIEINVLGHASGTVHHVPNIFVPTSLSDLEPQNISPIAKNFYSP